MSDQTDWKNIPNAENTRFRAHDRSQRDRPAQATNLEFFDIRCDVLVRDVAAVNVFQV